MAYEESLRSVSLDADATIGIYTGVPGLPGSLTPNNGKQFRFVKITGPNRCGLATDPTTELADGVLQNKPQYPGEAATMGFSGISMVELGGTVTAGDPLTYNNTGRPIVGDPDTDRIVAKAIASGDVGHLIPALLKLNS
jgi:hypothetical protein